MTIENPDWSDIEEQVDQIKQNTVTAASRKAYKNSYCRFLSFVACHFPHLLSTGLSTFLGNASDVSEKELIRKIKDWIELQPTEWPVDFNELNFNIFFKWLMTLEKTKKSGETTKLGFHAHASHRSGFFNLYKQYKVKMSEEMVDELSDFFRGLRRTIARKEGEGHISHTSGKDPLSFDLLQYFSKQMFHQTTKDFIFARCFLLLAWNLMARSQNTFNIHYTHISWGEDSLRIYFSHMKNDQAGQRPKDPRNIFANPLNPDLCPILALGVFWACNGFKENQTALFEGGSQYERFRRALEKLMNLSFVAAELQRRGMSAEQFGTHSFRKGAATYCSSGSTACPSPTAIHLRAGWHLGTIQSTYYRYSDAGDMHVGRTVVGLPPMSAKFATLPPHFTDGGQLVDSAVELMFPNRPVSLNFVLEHCLASLVYHSDYLRTLPKNHPVLSTPIFLDEQLLNNLRARVKTGYMKEQGMAATGIPPHVKLFAKFKRLEAMQNSFFDFVERKTTDAAQWIMGELEKKAIGLGTVTFDGLRDVIRSELSVLAPTLNREIPISNSPEPVQNTNTAQLFFYNGSFHKVPEDFKFAGVSARQMWLLWCCGDPANHICAYRYLTGKDMPTPNMERRLSDVRRLMSIIENAAMEHTLERQPKTLDEAAAVFDDVHAQLALEELTPTHRKRRHGQLQWRTVLKHLTKKQRED